MGLFRRRKKVDIEIIKTEPIDKSTGEEESDDVSVAIVNTQKLKQTLQKELSVSDRQMPEVAEQIAEQIVEMALPDVVREARIARENGEIARAIMMLWQHTRRGEVDPPIEKELEECLERLQDADNEQLARVFFGLAGFRCDDKHSSDSWLRIGCRLTCTYQGGGRLKGVLTSLAGNPQVYAAYCLGDPGANLSQSALGEISEEFDERGIGVNPRINFVVCCGSDAAINMHITVNRFSGNVTTIPLERDEMYRGVLNNGTKSYLESKLSAWGADINLFGETQPVCVTGAFFGREGYADEITKAINKGSSFYLLGVRNIGKTSLIYNLRNLGAFREHLYAYLQANTHRGLPSFDRAIRSVLEQWLMELGRTHPDIAARIKGETAEEAVPIERVSSFLRTIDSVNRSQQKNIRCLFILDDVNELLQEDESGESMWQRGAKELVSLLSRWPGIVVMGLTLWNLETLSIVEEACDALSVRIYLKPLKRNECDGMIQFIGAIINMKFEPESLERIYAYTGGHPLWTRFLCNKISGRRSTVRDKLSVKPADVENAVSVFLADSINFIDQSYLSLSKTEQGVLQSFKRSSDGVRMDDLLARSQEALLRLNSYGLVEEVSLDSGEYHLCSGLLARYLRS